jgi:tRNA dimethylallyltransferase
VQQSSRRYAKRQLTWFRRNPSIHWILRQENQDADSILLSARQILEEYDK